MSMTNTKQYEDYKNGELEVLTVRDGELIPEGTVDFAIIVEGMETILDGIEERGLYEEQTHAVTLKPGLELDIVVIVREVTE